MKFLLDANIPLSTMKVFEELNLDVKHARLISLGSAEDKVILQAAANERRILVTKDLEFGNTELYPISSHQGVMIIRYPSNLNATKFSEHIKEFLKSTDLAVLHNSIVIVDLNRYRIRKV